MTDFKVLRNQRSCFGGKGKWTPYKPRKVWGRLVPCAHGLHYCRDEQVMGWLDDELWQFVDLAPDDAIATPDKRVTSKGMITEKYKTWGAETARLLAIDCARLAVSWVTSDETRERLHACLDTAVGYMAGCCDNAALMSAKRLADEEFAFAMAEGGLGEDYAANAAAIAVDNVMKWSGNGETAQEVAMAAESAVDMARGYDECLSMRKAQYDLLCLYLEGEQGPFVGEE